MKYLGVCLDEKLIFGEQVRKSIEKADKSQTALNAIMPNVGGPNSSKRKLLYAVVLSVVLYAAPVWHEAIKSKTYRDQLVQLQRRGLIRIASAYRTATAEALQVITSQVPIDLLVEERVRIHKTGLGHLEETRTREREVTIISWQNRWEALVDKAQWTKKLVPDLSQWVKCQHKDLNYFTTQFWTGHGCFRSYLYKIGRAENARCHYCGREDTPKHVIFECDRWIANRTKVSTEIDKQVNVDIVTYMISNKNGWQKMSQFIKDTISKKEQDDRLLERR